MNIVPNYSISYDEGKRERATLMLELTTPSPFPAAYEDGTAIAIGSIIWCADSGIKWVLFDRSETTVTWCDSDDTTSQQVVNI